jgi:hypothetical protein
VAEYATPAGFRVAVETRLRERARHLRVPAYVLRRQAALERLLVRLMKVAPNRWALKGGLGLETRLGARARVSLDLDADHAGGADAARADLQRATIEDLGDHFGFAVTGSEELREAGVSLAVRYRVESSLAGRTFEPLQVDVTVAAPDPWDAEPACRPGLLAVLGLGPVDILLVPLERQVAEKLHAYTRPYKSGRTTRARDLVDLLLVRQLEHVDAAALRQAIERVFRRRETHPVPERLPAPPGELAVSYRSEAERVGLVPALEEAGRLLAEWLNPVLERIHGRGGLSRPSER